MCGRYTLTTPGDLLAEELGLDSAPDVAPRYNIAPTQESLIVVQPATDRIAKKAVWGFGGGRGSLLINARSETVAKKPAFRDAFVSKRCLIPADGFYEWLGGRGQRQPIYFSPADRRPMAFAGLWEWLADDPAGFDPAAVFTILTTSANELVARVHDRMPVILDRSSFSLWLNPETPVAELAGSLVPPPARALSHRPVNRAVNDVRFDSPACLDPPRELQLDLLTNDRDEL